MRLHSVSTSTEAKCNTFLVAVLKCQQKQLTEGLVYSVQSVHCGRESISGGSLRQLITLRPQEARMPVFMVPLTFNRLGLSFSDNLI